MRIASPLGRHLRRLSVRTWLRAAMTTLLVIQGSAIPFHLLTDPHHIDLAPLSSVSSAHADEEALPRHAAHSSSEHRVHGENRDTAPADPAGLLSAGLAEPLPVLLGFGQPVAEAQLLQPDDPHRRPLPSRAPPLA